MPRHIVLVGLMASGKSTVGPLLARRLGRPFVDNDERLARRTGRSARALAGEAGAAALHRAEAGTLLDALGEPVPAVIAAAAAAPLEADVRAALARADVVYLHAQPALLAARVAGAPASDAHRPFVDGDPTAVLTRQYGERDATYRALATLVVEAADDPAALAGRISAALGPRAPGTRRG